MRNATTSHSTPESEILQDVFLALGSRPDVRLWRQNTGVARTATGGVVRFGVPGQADLSGVVRVPVGGGVGIRLEVEVKSAQGRQSPAQKAWSAMIGRFGGIYILTRSAADAVAQLDAAIARVVASASGAGAP